MIAALLFAGILGNEDLIGQWRYDGFVYEGKRHPIPNPDLNLTFTFFPENRVRLFWNRNNEPGYCEREARYDLTDDKLYQKITWVNPNNAAECQKDPDMQMGTESVTPIRKVSPTELHLIFDLNGKEFDYILRREY